MNSLETVQKFISHIFSGELEAALKLVAPDAQFTPGRVISNPDLPIYQTFTGPAGASEFFRHFGEMLEPVDFKVEASFFQGEHVAMHGSLHHRSRKTGRDFLSDWALICWVHQGRLSFYHFYEDTVALETAVLPVCN